MPPILTSLIYFIFYSKHKVPTSVVVWMRMDFRGSHTWVFGPQLVKLFGKEEEVWPCWRKRVKVCHWEWGLFQKPMQGSVCLCPLLSDRMWALSCCSSTMPTCLPWYFCHDNGLTLWNCEQAPSLMLPLQVALAVAFYHTNITVTKPTSLPCWPLSEIQREIITQIYWDLIFCPLFYKCK